MKLKVDFLGCSFVFALVFFLAMLALNIFDPPSGYRMSSSVVIATTVQLPTITQGDIPAPRWTTNPSVPLLETAVAAIDGVESVGSVTILGDIPIVDVEARVSEGYNNTDTARAIMNEAMRILVSASLDFSVILDDGSPVAYNWDHGDDIFRITPLSH